MAVAVEAPTVAASRIASSSAGKAYRMSVSLSTSWEAQPPAIPASTPRGTPTSSASETAMIPTYTVLRAPTRSREAMSTPYWSVPSRCGQPGASSS